MGGQSSKVTGGHWSAPGQTEKSGWATGKSALPSRTDIIRPARLVRFLQERHRLDHDPSAQVAGIVN